MWTGKRMWVWIGGEDASTMLDARMSGENGGDEEHGLEDKGEYEGEFCGEVRGERPNQGAGVFGQLDSKRSEEQLLLSLPSARFCLNMSAGAEALRSHIEELPLLTFFPNLPPLSVLSEVRKRLLLLSGT